MVRVSSRNLPWSANDMGVIEVTDVQCTRVVSSRKVFKVNDTHSLSRDSSSTRHRALILRVVLFLFDTFLLLAS